MMSSSTRKGQKWTVEEDQQLTMEFKQQTSIHDICELHHRTASGIITRLHKLHLYPEQLDQIVKNNIQSLPLAEDEQLLSTKLETYICVLDTETTGKNIPLYHVSHSDKWSGIRLVQFAYELYKMDGSGSTTCIEKKCMIIQPDGFIIPDEVIAIHGITNTMALEKGISIHQWCQIMGELLPRVHTFVAHNMEYDSNVILSELYRYKQESTVAQWNMTTKDCTMLMGKRLVGKWSKLAALAEYCSITVPSGLHNADVDTHLCAKIYFYLRTKHISNKKHVFMISQEDREIFKVLGGRWDGVHKVWTMDEAEPFFRYAKKWLL